MRQMTGVIRLTITWLLKVLSLRLHAAVARRDERPDVDRDERRRDRAQDEPHHDDTKPEVGRVARRCHGDQLTRHQAFTSKAVHVADRLHRPAGTRRSSRRRRKRALPARWSASGGLERELDVQYAFDIGHGRTALVLRVVGHAQINDEPNADGERVRRAGSGRSRSGLPSTAPDSRPCPAAGPGRGCAGARAVEVVDRHVDDHVGRHPSRLALPLAGSFWIRSGPSRGSG